MRKIVLSFLLFLNLSPLAAQETYRVTTLADSGRGSLREALARGNRNVIFEVGGTIRLQGELKLKASNVSIDGSTAPDPGITLTGGVFSIEDARQVKVSHLRFRQSPDDNVRIIGGCRDILLENCTSTHGGDGAIDISHHYKTLKRPKGVTIRRCLIACTEKAMLVASADDLTLEENLFTNNGQRNPQLHDAKRFLFANNVVRNFGTYGFRARGGSTGDAIGNIIPLSPKLPNRPDRTFIISDQSGATRVYCKDNVGPQKHPIDRLSTLGNPVNGDLPPIIRPARLLGILDEVGAHPHAKLDETLIEGDVSVPYRPSLTKDN